MMRFACLTQIAPGADLAAQCQAIAAAGCAGVETLLLPAQPLERWQAELVRAAGDAGLHPVVVILGGLALFRPGQLGWALEALEASAELGAAALVTPEYRAQDPLPLLPPFPPPPPAEVALVEAQVLELVAAAGRCGGRLLLEPLTQFEGRFWRDVATPLELCRRIGGPHLALALDLHNMNLTEASIAGSISAAGDLVGHVHLADSNRRLPGEGHLDFAAALAALSAGGYAGWYSFECAVAGDFVASVRRCSEALRALAPDA